MERLHWPLFCAFLGMTDQAKAFFKKFGNDWCTNLAGMLAYNFLGAMFPLLLGVLALSALFLPSSLVQQVGTSLNGAIPSAANGSSGLNLDFNSVLQNFRQASGLTAIISLLALLWTGSSLFGVMENCFSIIYRTKDRTFVWQKLMSIAMIVIFAVLTPLSFVASTISGSYQQLTRGFGGIPGLGLLFAAGGYLIGILFAFALFFLIYVIVPNLEIAPGHAWRGGLVAAVLFEAVNLVFPVYTTHFMGKSQFGSVAGLLAVLTLWFWVISLILLLGAEVNSFFALGQRATADDLPGVLHGMKVHNEMRRGDDATSTTEQQRVMEDVQPEEPHGESAPPSRPAQADKSHAEPSRPRQAIEDRWR
jgi:membrane protein